jgi:hypothetical protein
VIPEHNTQLLGPDGSFVANTSVGSIKVTVTADGYQPVTKTVKGGLARYCCAFILAPTSGSAKSHADCERK